MLARIHAVDYTNAWPLTLGLREEEGLRVTWATPSECALALKERRCDAALLPVGALAEVGPVVCLSDLCISSMGPVRSVLLVARKPWAEVTKVALDRSSRTSAELARIVLEWKGCRPEFTRAHPNLERMLEEAEGALLIGDAALRAATWDLEVLDLGQQWTERTGLPFVYAVWALRRGWEQSALPEVLRRAHRWSRSRIRRLAQEAAGREGLPTEMMHDYLSKSIRYRLGEPERAATRRFLEELRKRGRVDAEFQIEFLEDSGTRSESSA